MMETRLFSKRLNPISICPPLGPGQAARTACLLLWFCLLAIIPQITAQKKVSSGVIVRELALHKEVHALVEDHDGFIWAGTSSGLYRFDGHEFVLVAFDTASVRLDGSVPVKALVEDPLGRLWISTMQEVFVLSKDRRSVVALPGLPEGVTGHKNVINISIVGNEAWLFNHSSTITCYPWDSDGRIIHSRAIQTPSYNTAGVVMLKDGGFLFELDLRKDYLHLSADRMHIKRHTPPSENSIFIRDPRSETLYAIGPPSIFKFDEQTQTFNQQYSFEQTVMRPLPCWTILSSKAPGSLWIGSRLGHLLHYTPEPNEYIDITDVLTNRLFDGRFFTSNIAIEDHHGGLWLGTNLGLAYIKIQDAQYFQTLPLPQSSPARQSFSTRGIDKDKNGHLWVSSYVGLFKYEHGQPVKEYLIWNDVIKENVDPVVYSFLPGEDQILMLSEGNGLLKYDYATDSIYRWFPSSYFAQSEDKEVKALQWGFEIFKDHTGDIWLGMMAGIFRMNAKGEIQRDPNLKVLGREAGRIYDITEDKANTLWIATATGLYSVNEKRDKVEHYTFGLQDPPKIQCLLLEESSILWLGTRANGLFRFDPASGLTAHITTEQGLADNTVCTILKGDDGHLWITTNQGMSRYDPLQGLFTNFYMEDGLPENEFNQASSFKDSDGSLYFGSVNGVITFHPRQKSLERPASNLRITRINVHDGSAGTTISHLYNSYLAPSIDLDFRDKYFTVYFSENDPTPYSKENYAYRLSGLDDHWQMIGEQNSIQFTGLQPGSYTLQIKTLHHQEGDAAMVEVPVFIARPFFKRWYAYLIYILVIGIIAFLIVKEYFKRKHIHRQLQLEQDHKLRLQEINRSKSTFFTNITHEFKTPLTLIQGPAEEITRLSKDPQVSKQAGLISKSAKSILALVNQLLELGKLEANLEAPQFHRLDIVSHVRRWIEKFEPLARQKEIELRFETTRPSMYVDFDPVKFETVINNLLSNALKFTPEKGKVMCKIQAEEKHRVSVTVSDNGPGIPIEEQEHIFDRFFQGKNSVLGGTGIGLAFVREMVRIHDGTVALHSVPGKGADFIVSIPIEQEGIIPTADQTSYASESIHISDETEDNLEAGAGEQPLILVVEDHEDVADLIEERLGSEYRVIHAPNGRDGHRAALDQIPDLIITDVMMPVMDGYSLTYLLKNDINTSHIPVIMLTARDGVAARIEGRSSGADVYLEKPFSPKELHLTVRNLLTLRASVTSRATQQVIKNAGDVHFDTAPDNQFYQSFMALLEDNIGESTLSVEVFTQRLGISRTQLHRKLKALTGLSVNQIVRNVRLQKGLALLRKGHLNIAEVAYQVGFSSPAYFTERFKEYYGHPPSEVEKVATH